MRSWQFLGWRNILCLWLKPKIQFPFHEALLQILSRTLWVPSTASHFISSSYVFILHLHLCLDLLSDPFPSDFRLMYFSSLPRFARFTSPWFYHLTGIRWVKIMKFLNMKFSPSLWYILPHKYNAAFWPQTAPFQDCRYSQLNMDSCYHLGHRVRDMDYRRFATTPKQHMWKESDVVHCDFEK